METSGIYKIVNRINGKYYVGSARTIRLRWNEHRTDLNRRCHHNAHLINAWHRYGPENFDFVVVEECPAEKLIEVEQRYLDEARQNGDSAYNLSFVAGGGEITAEARAKISASLLRHYTEHPETHERLRQSHLGKKHTPEHRANVSASKLGEKHPMYDDTIFTFRNTFTGETFVGTRNHFYTKYGLRRSDVNSLMRGRLKSVKKWAIVL